MTRINTNISALTAQQNLSNSNNQLQITLTRLSTGLRINSAADDPAGMIAATDLSSNIGSTKQAISNSQVASQMISTADSALSQISSLLTTINGLITSAANTGSMSANQIAANQLQIDSSLEAVNRIAQTTTFQGQNLLNGSLGFQVTQGTGFGAIQNLEVDQANLGTNPNMPVDIKVTQLAAQAKITATANDGVAGNVKATGTVTFTDGSTLAVTAASAGTTSNDIGVKFVESASQAAGTASAAFDSTTNLLTVTVNNSGTTSANTIAAAINNDTAFTAAAGGTTPATNGYVVGTDGAAYAKVVYVAKAGAGSFTINALRPGKDAVKTINITSSALLTATNPQITSYDATTGALTLQIWNGGSTAISDVVNALNSYKDSNGNLMFNASVTAAGTGLDGTGGANTDVGSPATGTTTQTAGGDAGVILTNGTGTSGLQAKLTLEIGGSKGSQLLTFNAGATAAQMAIAINKVTDATGVTANATGDNLQFLSQDYGKAASVSVKVVNEDTGGTFGSLLSSNYQTGTDIGATVNNVTAVGTGNNVSFSSPTLAFSADLNPVGMTVGQDVNFTITGGGALFQLGSVVTSAQQARLGIQSVDTATLGGTVGRLYEIGSGQGASLTQDTTKAAEILQAALDTVTSLRGRLGAFQTETVNSNISALTNAVTNLTGAQSNIQDANFAEESANVTREQILVQSGTTVLGIANSSPASVLSLLQKAAQV